MTFQSDIAQTFLGADDRDRAMYFAGRQDEIDDFNRVVAYAGDKAAARFRIYQGPPGCGKTSLANHLAEIRDDILFVPCHEEDLADQATVLKAVRRAAMARKSAAWRAGDTVLDSVAEYLNTRTLSEAVTDVVAKTMGRDAPVALHLDEAHGRAHYGARLLRNLHTVGLGVPCVVVLTGLGHTRDVIAGLPGLTRPARDAVRDLDPLKEEECAWSTRMMLDALRCEGGVGEREAMAGLAGKMAHGWPQHLHTAQRALCEELVRVDGRLADVDIRAVRDRSDAMRHEYYAARMHDHPLFALDEAVTQAILMRVDRTRPTSLVHLDRLCTEVTDRHAPGSPLFAEYPPPAFARALVEKGLVRKHPDGFALSIPTMAQWARSKEDGPPSSQSAGTGR